MGAFWYIEALEDFREGNENRIRSAGPTPGGMHRVLQNFRPGGEKPWTREFSPEEIKPELHLTEKDVLMPSFL